MIKIYLPNATTVQVTTFLTNRTITAGFYTATFHASGALFPTGVMVEFDEPDESWQAIKTVIAAAATALGLARIRVLFMTDDISKTGGRLAARSFWVNADGTQAEV